MTTSNQSAPQSQGAQSAAAATPPEYPSAGTILILSLVGLAIPVLSFVAWFLGAKAKQDISEGANYYWGGRLRAGYMIGKIYSIITIVWVVIGIVAVIIFLATAAGSSS